ncbi:DUF4258 domain-containing protein [Brevibacillus laterosporus]|uniref:DUF4258 domain-containing protein n=1 Tax=Brevibacillus laterosporus TaxID=1465 RepID=UPI0006BCAEBA|nr:hypothetical protein AVT09_gp182 [Brevibacillus phage Sundance]ALA47998.1 hypothetical protein SUNDANCE_182 [Brevibacillus phage Sundance]
MNEKLILQTIAFMINNGARIIETGHATERMEERRINKRDIVEILLNPTYISNERESNQYYGKNNYRVMGKHDWSVVVSVYYPEKLIIITVID